MKQLTKRIMALFLTAVMMLQVNVPVFGGTPELAGSGTEKDPYIIQNASELRILDQKDQYLYAELAANLNLSEIDTAGESSGCPYYLKNFRGQLNGNGHTIRGAKNQSNLISKFGGGELKNFTFEVSQPSRLVLEQTLGKDHRYTDVKITGTLKWTASNNNESPIVVYADGNTAMTRVSLDLEMDSPTYHGLFIGYEPVKQSHYEFVDCSVKGVYTGSDLGILFGNGSMPQNSDYGFQHVFGTNGVEATATIEVKNMDLSEAVILATKTQPHILCGVSYDSSLFDSMEAQMKEKTTGYDKMKKAEPLTGYSAELNQKNQLKIQVSDQNTDTKAAYFVVVSEVYSNSFNHGVWDGTQKHSVTERIDKIDGVNTYYSSLGKVKFHDSKNGIYGTTGQNGELRTITVDGETYYALFPDLDNAFYTFHNKESISSNTSKLSDVKVWAYDADGHLLNEVPQMVSGDFAIPKIKEVSAREKTLLKDVELEGGWAWISPDTKIVYGGQIAFARKGEEIAPVNITGEPILVESVALNRNELSMEAGSQAVLKVTVTPADAAEPKVTWRSSNDQIAEVDETGKITAVKPGKAVITAQAGEKTAQCQVVVYEIKNPQVPEMDVTKPSEDIQIGVKEQVGEAVQTEIEEIVEQIAEGKETAQVSKETAQKLEEALKSGESIQSQIVAKNVSKDQVDQDEQKEISLKLDKTETVAQYLDLSIVLEAGGTTIGTVNTLGKPIAFRIAVPKDLQKDGRTFSVVRVHNGKAEKLAAAYTNGIVTFETDRFSTYALIYTDKKSEVKPSKPAEKPTYQYVSTRKIKVSWWRKKSADGFVIYAKAGNGKYKKIKTVGKKKSATVNVKSGKSYQFKVKAYRNVKKGKKTVRKYWRAYPAAGRNQGKTIKAVYKNVTGYKGYVLYLKVGKKPYKKVKTTAKGGTILYTNKKAKVGTSYQFRLRGYHIKNGRRVYTTIKAKKA